MKNLLVLLTLCIISLEAQIAQPERIIFFEWGKGKNQMGLLLDDMPYGPSYFNVDQEGNIYISDEFNKRFKKFDKDGNFLWEMALEQGRHTGKIIPLKNGKILYANGREIVFADQNGNIKKKLEARKYPGIGLKWVGMTEEYIFLVGFRGDLFVFDTSMTLHQKFTPADLPPGGCIPANGDLYFVDVVSDRRIFSVKRVHYNPQGMDRTFEEARTIQISRKHERRVATAGLDRYGGMYFYSISAPKTPWIFEKYNSTTGEKLGEVQIKWQIGHDVSYPFLISLDGDLYVLSSDKSGMWIDKYPASLFDQ